MGLQCPETTLQPLAKTRGVLAPKLRQYLGEHDIIEQTDDFNARIDDRALQEPEYVVNHPPAEMQAGGAQYSLPVLSS